MQTWRILCLKANSYPVYLEFDVKFCCAFCMFDYYIRGLGTVAYTSFSLIHYDSKNINCFD